MLRHKPGLSLFLLCFLLLAIMGSARAGSSELTIQSPAFSANGPIPVAYTCSGDNRSPTLAWTGVPAATQTLALIVRDPDAPMGSYVHWVIYNMPASLSGLPAGLPTTTTLDNGAVQGVNGRGTSGYHGPCPPPGPAHHYHFRLYALDAKLNLAAGANAVEVEQALKGHVLASADLVGTFAR
jgi:Raf kinase inhibitor-like YbhB/YbcL family protein